MNRYCILFFLLAFYSNAQDFKSYEQPIAGTSIKFKMVAVAGGKFKMGSPSSEKNREADETQGAIGKC